MPIKKSEDRKAYFRTYMAKLRKARTKKRLCAECGAPAASVRKRNPKTKLMKTFYRTRCAKHLAEDAAKKKAAWDAA